MKLQSALHLADLGFRVFPIGHNSKKPAIDGWKEAATTDPARVKQWWKEDPGYNIGVATGQGIVVVDADVKDDRPGLDSLDILDMSGLPTSFRVATPSGGKHVYLTTAHKHRNRVDTIPDHPGIDIRSDGGYVLGPGSTIDGKSYSVVGNPISVAPAPQWFDDLLLKDAPRNTPKSATPLVDLDRPENVARATDWLTKTAPDAIEGAGGDDTTYKVVGRLRDLGVSEATALELMLEHWNEQKASPPWLPDDLAVKVKNAFEYATGGWGAHTAAAEFDAIDIEIGEGPMDLGKADPLIRASDFAALDKPERKFVVPDMVPDHNVTTINGDGATGKSLLAMQLGVACATGTRWIGQPVKKGPVLYLSAEDDADETHIRLKEIAAAERLDLSAIKDLHIAVLAGRDALLATENTQQSRMVKTSLFGHLRGWMAAVRPVALILDNLADIFGGNENAKHLARQFVGMLRGLAIEFECAVILLSHPSLSGMASGSGSSGNVAWNNSVRSRLYLQRDKDKDGTETDPNRRFIETKKANYGPSGRQIDLRWENGRFVAIDIPELDDVEGIETAPETKADRAKRIFLEMVERFNRERRAIAPTKGLNYAPAVFSKHSRAGGLAERILEIAMNELFATGEVEVEEVGPPSKRRQNIVLCKRQK